MNARTRKVLEQAMELPAEERTELARELVESLEAEGVAGLREAWR